MSSDIEALDEALLVVNDDGLDHEIFNIAAQTRTRAGNPIIAVENATGPASLCCSRFNFYPTRAIITTRGEEKGGVEQNRFVWNARDHRKMRFPTHLIHAEEGKGAAQQSSTHHPSAIHQRIRIMSWEPRNITWWNCLVGEIANTLWVVNGIYAVWPELARNVAVGATNITYYTGVIGAGMFVITGYLGWVEAINHSHGEVRTSPSLEEEEKSKKNVRMVHRQPALYGIQYHPLGFPLSNTLEREMNARRVKDIAKQGYPLVEDTATGQYVTTSLYARVLEKFNGDANAMENDIRGRKLNLKLGDHIICVKVESLHDEHSTVATTAPVDHMKSAGYVWWTKHFDLCHIGVFNALVFFVATIVFWIPAIAWYPMDKLGDPKLKATIFWIYILQILPSIGFIYVGFAAMAEAAGSWIKPDFNSIGWWASFLNFIGGIGFFLYAVLSLPGVVGDPGCCDDLNKWGAAMATFWGSCAFWVAGLLQWIEFSSEHPITLGGGSTGAPAMKK